MMFDLRSHSNSSPKYFKEELAAASRGLSTGYQPVSHKNPFCLNNQQSYGPKWVYETPIVGSSS